MAEPLTYEALRERIGCVLDNDHREQGFTLGRVEHGEHRRMADLILADLRIERVGEVSPDYDGFPRFSGTTPSDERMNHERRCQLYRFDAPSWQRHGVLAASKNATLDSSAQVGTTGRQPWSCTTDGVTEPCGDCDGCRYDAATTGSSAGEDA